MSLYQNTAPALETFVRARAVDWGRSARVDPLYQKLAMMAERGLKGELYWCSTPLCQLIQSASRGLPDWSFREELVPSPSGFFWLSQPLDWERKQGSSDKLRAFSWALDDAGQYVFSGWCDPIPEKPNYPLLPVAASQGVRQGQLVITEREPTLGSWDNQIESMTNLLRFIGAAFLFLEQEIAFSQTETPDRHVRRRLEKAGLTYPHGIKLVYLRSPHNTLRSDSDPSPVDWRVRWLVRGHWRQQYYASDQSHRPIWIAPHIKGPEDRPLKTPDQTVFAVVR